MEYQDSFQRAALFSAERHGTQKIPGSNAPYILHPIQVAMELTQASLHSEGFDLTFAVEVALLHDLLEDTTCTYKEIKTEFGPEVANGVLALTKNEKLLPENQIEDSLERIKNQPKEIWAVKLADRISNMQRPPTYWSNQKKRDYQKMAGIILTFLQGSNPYLEKRLAQKILNYDAFIQN